MEENNQNNNNPNEAVFQPEVGDWLLCHTECEGFTVGNKYQVTGRSQTGEISVIGDDYEVNYIEDLSFFTPCEAGSVIDHPAHYNREGAMETIDEMVILFGIEETMSFCKLNAWKYRARALDKGGKEDMQKSDWYIKKYKELSAEQTFD